MKRITILLVSLVAIMACGNPGAKKQAEEKEDKLKAFREEVDSKFVGVNSAEDVAAFIHLAGLELMAEAPNDPLAWEKYKGNELLAAMNMGVYMADAHYLLAFEESKDSYLSIMAAKQLAEVIGVVGVFDEMVITKIEDGIVPGDEMLNKYADAIFNSKKKFTDQGRLLVLGSHMMGKYVETLYLLFNNIFYSQLDVPDDIRLQVMRKLLIVTGEQLDMLPNMIKMGVEYTGREDLPLIVQLKELYEMDKALTFKGTEGNLTAKDIFENPRLKQMNEKVKSIRDFIIMNE